MNHIREIIITPEVARSMLEKNNSNRPLAKPWVSELASRMKKGEWLFNGDTIRMNGSNLIDGQHRLHAVIESGVAIRTIIVDNLDFCVFKTIDDGRRRSASDTLSVIGEKNTSNLAAALTVVDCYYRQSFTRPRNRSNILVEELLQKYPGVRESVNKLISARVKITVPSVVHASHYIFSELSPSEADTFIDQVLSGDSLQADDPVFLLRSRLIENLASKAKLQKFYVLALFIKAWNHKRLGSKIKFLRYRSDGDSKEGFPVAV